MKKLLTAIIALFPFLLSAQPPDYDKIGEAITDKSSEYYYTTLFSRYMEADTTLTLDHYRHVYYGFSFQLEYEPFLPPETGQELLLLKENRKLEIRECETIISYLKSTMIRRPFNLSYLNLLTYVYGLMGDTENEVASARRFSMVVEAIKSTGDGKKEKTPWHVIYMDNISDLMTAMEIRYKDPIIVSLECLYLPFLQKTKGIKGYYFDFGRVYVRPPDPTDKKSRGLEFNGIKIK